MVLARDVLGNEVEFAEQLQVQSPLDYFCVL